MQWPETCLVEDKSNYKRIVPELFLKVRCKIHFSLISIIHNLKNEVFLKEQLNLSTKFNLILQKNCVSDIFCKTKFCTARNMAFHI